MSCESVCTSSNRRCINRHKYDYNGKRLCTVHYLVEKRKSEECSICLSGLSYPSLIRTGCDHVFHYKCLKRWYDEEKDTCPLCRATLDHGTVVKLNRDMIDWFGSLICSFPRMERRQVMSGINHVMNAVLSMDQS